MIALLGLAAGLSSCASQHPAATALVNDPDARGESSVPWNRPANWEGRGNIPSGGFGGANDPTRGSTGGTGGY